MSKVGVVLSGCGVFDGAEVHEASATLIALSQLGIEFQCMAPNMELDEIDHLTQEPTGNKRNVLVESARIARGEIVDLAQVRGDEYDGFVVPGGYGAAKNLCTFAMEGADCSVNDQVERVLKEAHDSKKPIGFMCIAPALCAKVFGDQSVKVTIGSDPGTAQAIRATGAEHIEKDALGIVVDEDMKIVSNPAYMEAKNPAQVYEGIRAMIEQLNMWL